MASLTRAQCSLMRWPSSKQYITWMQFAAFSFPQKQLLFQLISDVCVVMFLFSFTVYCVICCKRIFLFFVRACLYQLCCIQLTLDAYFIRELTIREGLAPRRQTWQRVDWIEYFVFRANFDRFERAHTVRTSLAGTSRPHTNCCY